jgi:beta-galactosidase GanA
MLPGSSLAHRPPLAVLAVLFALTAFAIPTAIRADADIPHLRKNGAVTQLVVDGKPFLILNAEADNSSGSSLETMEESFQKANALNANTVVVPIYWELIEPEEGKYDFELLDGLIRNARKHNLKLVLLWFGTYKNTFSSYTPAWVKVDRKRFFRSEPIPGKDWGAISTFCTAACAADAKAFAAVMRRIRHIDREAQTVLMVQIENEMGQIGASRDHSALAEKAFHEPVPTELMSALLKSQDSLLPELKTIWEAAGRKGTGTWEEVFGKGADEAFMCWYTGRFADAVAVAGKAEYPLPMFVNAWLEGEPGSYPSGGPVSRMMDIWRAAAPHIDFLAPDIYGDTDRCADFCGRYSRSGNPLLIVESSPHPAPANAFTAIAGYGAIGFGPYPLEAPFNVAPVAEVYACLRSLTPVLTPLQGTRSLTNVLLKPGETKEWDMGNFHVYAAYATSQKEQETNGSRLPGHGLIAMLGNDDYLLVGCGFKVNFAPLAGHGTRADVLSVDEGYFEKGIWVRGRRLNGDEAGDWLSLSEKTPGYTGRKQTLHIRRIRLNSY